MMITSSQRWWNGGPPPVDRWTKSNGEKKKVAADLLRIKPEDLQTFHSRSARQRDITLTLLKHLAKIDLDAL
jgi:hypothetical protein